MNVPPVPDEHLTTCACDTHELSGPHASWHAHLSALIAGCRQVFGIPDYNRYLAHHAERHPDQPVLTRRDFFAQSIDRRYGRNGPRCC